MAIHRREAIDQKLESDKEGSIKGVWLLVTLCLGLVARFLWSMSPHKWRLSNLASMELKETPQQGDTNTQSRLEAQELK